MNVEHKYKGITDNFHFSPAENQFKIPFFAPLRIMGVQGQICSSYVTT